MRRVFGPRFAAEAAAIVGVAVLVWYERLSRLEIVAAMAGIWLAIALLEWSRAQATAILTRAQHGAEQLLASAGLGQEAIAEVSQAIVAAAAASVETGQPAARSAARSAPPAPPPPRPQEPAAPTAADDAESAEEPAS